MLLQSSQSCKYHNVAEKISIEQNWQMKHTADFSSY